MGKEMPSESLDVEKQRREAEKEKSLEVESLHVFRG